VGGGVDDEQGRTDDVAGGDSDPPVPAIGAATTSATTAVPSLRPCGDDAPALLPGSLPVSPLCMLFSNLHSVTARYLFLFSIFIPNISICYFLAFISGSIYMICIIYNIQQSGSPQENFCSTFQAQMTHHLGVKGDKPMKK